MEYQKKRNTLLLQYSTEYRNKTVYKYTILLLILISTNNYDSVYINNSDVAVGAAVVLTVFGTPQ